MTRIRKCLSLIFAAVLMACALAGCGAASDVSSPAASTSGDTAIQVTESGEYDSKDEVAAYIHEFSHLPGNYITKSEAKALGWEGGSLEPYAPGKSIGGDRYGNYEGLLPSGTSYTECDIDTCGAKSRGAKRIVFGADGSVYYTSDHYESFEQLY